MRWLGVTMVTIGIGVAAFVFGSRSAHASPTRPKPTQGPQFGPTPHIWAMEVSEQRIPSIKADAASPFGEITRQARWIESLPVNDRNMQIETLRFNITSSSSSESLVVDSTLVLQQLQGRGFDVGRVDPLIQALRNRRLV